MESLAPRDCLVHPNDFGKAPHAQWRADLPKPQLATAETQHRYALAVRDAVKRTYGSIREYCSETNQNYQRVGRVLRGTTKMQVDDIGIAADALKLSVSFQGTQTNDFVGAHELTAGDPAMRDALGAFYTPDDVALYLVRQLRVRGLVLEPAFGDGSFLRACRTCGFAQDELFGCEIDTVACEHAERDKLLGRASIFRGSFFDLPLSCEYANVIGNPPFVRIRALDKAERVELMSYCQEVLGHHVGEEASEWLPFLLKSVKHVRSGGSLAFVLPLDFTYLKYSLFAWEVLGESFGEIRVIRTKERLFKDVLQDVILLVAHDKGGCTDFVHYECHETVTDLIAGRNALGGNIRIDEIVQGQRPFQRALVDAGLLEQIKESPLFCQSNEEANFHIGYVSGHKDFFHPSDEIISEYSLPRESLVGTVVSSRQLGSVGYRTSCYDAPGRLWLPHGELTKGERAYVAWGESRGIHRGYKCSRRKPWWIVPSVTTPDAIFTVFGDLPYLILNDGDWAISNSLLGAWCQGGISPEAFCESWYSSVTRLSIELQIHSLGGGVLIAVPNEVNQVVKLRSAAGACPNHTLLADHVASNRLVDAYHANDAFVADALGTDFINEVQKATETLASWRKRS